MSARAEDTNLWTTDIGYHKCIKIKIQLQCMYQLVKLNRLQPCIEKKWMIYIHGVLYFPFNINSRVKVSLVTGLSLSFSQNFLKFRFKVSLDVMFQFGSIKISRSPLHISMMVLWVNLIIAFYRYLIKQLRERPENFRTKQGFEPWPLWNRCSAQPFELSG